MLTVSADTVYDLFAKGELPGRKVGRKWITTKAAVLRLATTAWRAPWSAATWALLHER